jgi:fused signal recognition particle receptor
MGVKEVFRFSFKPRIFSIFSPGKPQAQILEELEESLILSDVSPDIVTRVIAAIRKKARGNPQREEYLDWIRAELEAIFSQNRSPALRPEEKNVLVLVGVNGSGKTTTAAKLAFRFRSSGKRVLLCAADTFRAAGSTQMALWGERLDIPVIGGSRWEDSGAVVYKAMQVFASRDFDVLIVDTAGRMQSRENLMRELEKLIKIIRKFDPGQPTETSLVLDAATGRNALVQAEKFSEFSGITSVILAKIDGTAKGGAVVSIVDKMKLPILCLGTGENIEDLQDFYPGDFVEALTGS